MADQHSDERVGTSNMAAESSESAVEIQIKTLDSQLYSFRVDKNMPVLAFKEKIASDVGLPVGQQRLIFRGKVLKDEHRLSEYHVESGHTLHLVARQPSESQPSSGTGTATANGSNTGQDGNAPGSRPRVGHVSHSVVLGTFGVGDQNEGGTPDISRVIGAVLNSIGIGGQISSASIGGAHPNMQFNIPGQVAQGNEAGVNVNNQGHMGNPSQPATQGLQIPLGAGIAIPTLATPIPDSLHTLSEFINHMEQALSQNGYRPNQRANGAERSPAVELPSSARGVPTPAALAVVLRHAQRLLSGPAIDSLSHTAGRLDEEESCTDITIRTQIQSEVIQSGLAMQHLGALLLELGRTMLTSRIGPSPAESSVLAGPAVYISPSGPNPLMVQPFPLQSNSLFGGHATPMNSTAFGPVGIGGVPRHINVHIHAGMGPRGANVEPNQGDGGNGTAADGVNLQTRGVDDRTRSENQTPAVNLVQPQGGVTKTEGQTDTGGVGNATLSSSATKSANDVEGASSSSAIDNSGNASAVPLGLGLGGLQPKRRSRQTKPEATSSSVAASDAPTSNARNTSNPAGGQLNPATIMNQVIANPALDGLLSGVSNQTGMGSPDMLRNMLGQLTQNPAMMNTVNQIAQQIDSNQDLSNMFSGMGGGSSGGGSGGGGGGGGFDLSSMVQQMMPLVAQAFGGGVPSSNVLQPPPSSSMDRELQHTTVNDDSSSDHQVNVHDLAEKIEHKESPEEVFLSVVEAAARLNDNGENGDGLSELRFEDGLAQEFMEMLKCDVSRRLEEEKEEE